MKYKTTTEKKLNARFWKNYDRLKWTDSKLQHFNDLNRKLYQMQNQLKQKMLKTAEEFSKLQKSEFPFLNGFKVIGQLCFEKTILDNDYTEEEIEALPQNQKSNIKKWKDLDYYTNSKVWQLVYDSAQNDFTPYSKDLMKDSDYSKRVNNVPEGKNLYLCSYINNLVNFNQTITYQDILECDISDFSPFVFITVNFDDVEIAGFRNYKQDEKFLERLLFERQLLHNHNFDWSKENIEKILKVNSYLWQKTAFIKEQMKLLSKKFRELAKTNDMFREFSIDAEIQYQNRNNPTDVADLNMLRLLERNTPFYMYSVYCNSDDEKINDLFHDETDEDINWNFEVFRPHLSDDQKKVKFNYFMHTIFIDGSTYSFEDLVRMKEEEFAVCWDINITC